MDQATYTRGGLTLQALRARVGDDVFFDILGEFAEKFRHAAASTADFIEVAERVSQQDDLDSLFDAWLYSEDLPDKQDLGLGTQ